MRIHVKRGLKKLDQFLLPQSVLDSFFYVTRSPGKNLIVQTKLFVRFRGLTREKRRGNPRHRPANL